VSLRSIRRACVSGRLAAWEHGDNASPAIEELIEVPVALLSTSPEREDTILVRDPFAD
jgi:hypothetical protein